MHADHLGVNLDHGQLEVLVNARLRRVDNRAIGGRRATVPDGSHPFGDLNLEVAPPLVQHRLQVRVPRWADGLLHTHLPID